MTHYEPEFPGDEANEQFETNDRVYCKCDQWTTVYKTFGTIVAKVKMEVDGAKQVKWRRQAAVPGRGKFKKKKTKYITNGRIQIKPKENTYCNVTASAKVGKLKGEF